MRSILFVDDEENILSGLKRSMRSMRKEWACEFEIDAKAALILAADKNYDVVVSDMRMPVMDGAQFLDRVREVTPQTVRIVLSGHSDLEMTSRSARSAHRYLAKPCSPDDLKEAISKAFCLRDRFSQPDLQRFAEGLTNVPSIPQVYSALRDALADENTDAGDIADIINGDPAITIAVLKLVNSSFFGMAQNIESPSHAVSLLGVDVIKNLTLAVELFTSMDAETEELLDFPAFWATIMTATRSIKFVAAGLLQEKPTIDQALTATVLCGLGKLMLATEAPAEYRQAKAQFAELGLSEAQRRVFGFTEYELGAYTSALWGLPDPIVEAICFIDQPLQFEPVTAGPLTACHLVYGHLPGSSIKLDEQYLQQLGLTDDAERYRSMVAKMAEK